MLETLVQFTEYPKYTWESFTDPHGFTRLVLRHVPTCHARIPHVNTVIFGLLLGVSVLVRRTYYADVLSVQELRIIGSIWGLALSISSECSIWRECSTVPGLHWSEGEDRTSNFLWLFWHELFTGLGLPCGLLFGAAYMFILRSFAVKRLFLNLSPPKLGPVLRDDELNGETSCSVCYDDMDTKNSVKLVACGHCFHRECILRWIPQRRVCPMCNKSL